MALAEKSEHDSSAVGKETQEDGLEMTAPEEMETRAHFLLRLRRTVSWLNEHIRDNALLLSRNHKASPADVLIREGARTKR